MTKEEAKNLLPGDLVEYKILDRIYKCNIIRLDDIDHDGTPDKAWITGDSDIPGRTITTISKVESLKYLGHDPKIQELIDKASATNFRAFTPLVVMNIEELRTHLRNIDTMLENFAKKLSDFNTGDAENYDNVCVGYYSMIEKPT